MRSLVMIALEDRARLAEDSERRLDVVLGLDLTIIEQQQRELDRAP